MEEETKINEEVAEKTIEKVEETKPRKPRSEAQKLAFLKAQKKRQENIALKKVNKEEVVSPSVVLDEVGEKKEPEEDPVAEIPKRAPRKSRKKPKCETCGYVKCKCPKIEKINEVFYKDEPKKKPKKKIVRTIVKPEDLAEYDTTGKKVVFEDESMSEEEVIVVKVPKPRRKIIQKVYETESESESESEEEEKVETNKAVKMTDFYKFNSYF